MNIIRIRTHGFTLIELMVVMAIVGVLGAIAIPSYTRYIKKARIAEATGNIQSIFSFQEMYYANSLSYTCLAANPSAVPSKGDRLNFDRGRTNWSLLGTPMKTGDPLYFQYQAWAVKYNSWGSGLLAGTDLCISSPTANITAGGGYCSNDSEVTFTPASLGFTSLNIVNGSSFIQERFNRAGVFITAVGDQDGDGICSYFMIYNYKNDIYKSGNTALPIMRNELE